MRILMVNFEFPPIGGGAAQAHRQLLNQYAHIPDLHVDVLTSGLGRVLQCEPFAERITLHRVPLRKANLHYWRKTEVIAWLFKARRQYRHLLRQSDYDLVHSFFAFPSGYLPYRFAARLPYILSLRGSDVPGYNVRLGLDYFLLAGLFRRIWRGASAIVANSAGLRDLARRFTPELDIAVIPNGVDTARFSPDPERQLEHPLKTLTVCRLISRKRLDLLIQAVARARTADLPVQLTIAGEGNLLDQLRNQADQLGVLEQVTFLGRVPDEQMPNVYRAHDVFLMSSAHEGMSNAMLEALASGLPVVTTGCEGVDELISDDNGIIVEPDAQAFAQALLKLDADRDLYRRMGRAAREQAQQFDWHNTAQKYLALYRDIIKSREDRSK